MRTVRRRPTPAVLTAVLLVVAACGDGGSRPSAPVASPSAPAEPVGRPLSSADIAALAAPFADEFMAGTVRVAAE